MKKLLSQDKEILLRNTQAYEYDNFFIKTRGIFGYTAQIRTVLLHLDPQKGDSILDAGCGTGLYSSEIAKKAKSILAVDFSLKSIEILREKINKYNLSNIQTLIGDLALISLPKNYFDKAVSVEVLQHIPTQDKKNLALKNIFSSLKPKGKFIMVVYRYGGWIKPPNPQEEFDHGGVGLYRFAFTPEDCYQIFKEVGFKIVHIGGVLNLHKKIRKRLPAWMSFIEVWFSKLRLSRKLGDYLIVVARKPS